MDGLRMEATTLCQGELPEWMGQEWSATTLPRAGNGGCGGHHALMWVNDPLNVHGKWSGVENYHATYRMNDSTEWILQNGVVWSTITPFGQDERTHSIGYAKWMVWEYHCRLDRMNDLPECTWG
ncbi:hypothetical protein AVEN_67210-1 [Araneus ventricosus]|uniref:Uncharacterized protein n=1 Tax=Araneus ventricosus TaxID=182803 RepID=A0A4Y2TQN3_ARAVE|nr:hypothetical protein AVEN_67210-1 [Araneus ventricosus]